MEERLKFIAAYLEGEWTMSELWRAYGISRPTGYEVLARYQAHGLDGVRERSRAAQHHPNQMAPALAEQVVQARHAHPRWGPRKLRAWMARKQPDVPWPAPSTIGTLLTRHGLVAPRRRVRRTPPPRAAPGRPGRGPNDVWCADFKGWFRTGDGRRCEPLTISDECSRFLLTCRAVERPDWEHTYPLFHRAFCAYGVPRAIRTDPRAPVCQPRGGRAVAPGAVVDQAGHPPATDRAGQAPAKRAPRAHAPDLEAGRGPAAPAPRGPRNNAPWKPFRHEYNYERPHRGIAPHPARRPLRAGAPFLSPPARRSLPRSRCRAPRAHQRRD